ncbi:MAG TPA: bifunctional oligoribonuclease/PAP phosphatase NrnA [Terriglobales bacterium]|nr:bifunctional oligoribonuclease/PAP phosphatase NrnA [Terriglobales bacterium]
MLKEVLREIDQRQHFVLTSHARPDGDAIGSVLACFQILGELGKQAEVVLHDPVPHIYRVLPLAEVVKKAASVNGKYEAAIVLECDSIQRTRLQGLEDHFLISIDHHVSGKPFANVNWIDPSACATAEMVYRLALEADVKITPEMATCLYTAVLTDTGSFCFVGTNECTFQLAEELVRYGADPAKIAQAVYFSNSASKMRLLGAALSNLQRDQHFAWMHVTREQMERCRAAEEDCEGLVNYALAIEGVEVALFFREIADGKWRISLRSKGAVDVSRVAAGLGGGGHRCASGCTADGPLPAMIERITAQLLLAGEIESKTRVGTVTNWRA